MRDRKDLTDEESDVFETEKGTTPEIECHE